MLHSRQILNALALRAVTKKPDIPDALLMVGSAEILTAQPIDIYKSISPQISTPIVSNVRDLSYEDVPHPLGNGYISLSDFDMDNDYYGNPVEVF